MAAIGLDALQRELEQVGRVYLRPIPQRPDAVELGWRGPSGVCRRVIPAETLPGLAGTAAGDFIEKALDRLEGRPREWAGLALERPLVMGIVNVTPDSFSDGGRFDDAQAAIDAAIAMLEAGADIVDVGGESTRPGAQPIEPAVEQVRVLPVVAAIAERGAVVSIDTRNSSTMAAALAAGARIVNDVTALGAVGAMPLVARSQAAAVVMHMRGEPQTQLQPTYEDVVFDIYDFLEERLDACARAGIPRTRLMVDPGIGFGKTTQHNCALIASLSLFRTLGCGVLLGASRKRFIAAIAGDCPPDRRLGGSLAAALAGVAAGADIVRVHDVPETVQALRVFGAIG